MPFWSNGKYYVDEPVNQLLGLPARKNGNFNSTRVIAEDKPMGMNMPVMPMHGEMIPTVDPLAGYGGMKSPVEKIPVKEAGKGRSK